MLILVIIIILGYPLRKKLLGLEKTTYFFGFKTTEKGIHLLVLLNEMHNSGWERKESRLIFESSVPIVHNKNVQQLWLFSVYVPCKFNYNWYTSSLSYDFQRLQDLLSKWNRHQNILISSQILMRFCFIFLMKFHVCFCQTELISERENKGSKRARRDQVTT